MTPEDPVGNHARKDFIAFRIGLHLFDNVIDFNVNAKNICMGKRLSLDNKVPDTVTADYIFVVKGVVNHPMMQHHFR